jgi:glycosyltransferase involved in cell wall biosynthesis
VRGVTASPAPGDGPARGASPASTLRLCLASAHFFPTHGGAQLRYLRYLPGFRSRGIEPCVFTGTPKAKKATGDDALAWDRSLPPGRRLPDARIDGTPVHRVRLPDGAGWGRSFHFNRGLVRFCRDPSTRPDVVQLVSGLQPRSAFWVRQIRAQGIPVVFAYTLIAELPRHPLRRWLRRATTRFLHERMDRIVVSSEVMKESVRSFGTRTPVEVIPNGVDVARFSPPGGEGERCRLRQSLGIEADALVVTAVGPIHPRKGTDLLLDAWTRLAPRFPQAHLFLVGLRKDESYPDLAEFRDRVRGLVEASGAPDRIHFTGLVRNVPDYLRASDVFAFPSRREGMPNVVLEAMATGLPSVLTPFVGLSPELGADGAEYLLAPMEGEGLAAALESLLRDPALRRRVGEAARRHVVRTMSLEAVLDRFARLYREVAGGRPGRP